MGAQWKLKGKLENSHKRSQVIAKMVKEIIIAAKSGEPDPDNNGKLRAAVEAAKKASVPKDNIERAIKRGAGLLDPVNYESVTFEGYTPHNVPVIIECLTDNRNRTSADMKTVFRKGSLGTSGSVGYLFDHVGLVVGSHPNAAIDFEGEAIEAGAQDVEKMEDEVQFICDKADLISVTKNLQDRGWQVTQSEFAYIAKAPVELPEAQRKEVESFLGEVDDYDDVRRIYTALKS